MSWNIMAQKHPISCFGSRYRSFFLKSTYKSKNFTSLIQFIWSNLDSTKNIYVYVVNVFILFFSSLTFCVYFSRLNTRKQNPNSLWYNCLFPASYHADPAHFHLLCLFLVMEFIQGSFPPALELLKSFAAFLANGGFLIPSPGIGKTMTSTKDEWAAITCGEDLWWFSAQQVPSIHK